MACIGDSITFGVGSSDPKSKSYPSQLQQLLKSTSVRNFGAPGATALAGGDIPYAKQPAYAEANAFVAEAKKNVTVIALLGANDARPENWIAPKRDAFAADYAALLDHFAALGATIVIVLPLHVEPNPYAVDGVVLEKQITPLIRKLAAEHHFRLIDASAGIDASQLSDGVHLTDSGYAALAKNIASALTAKP